VVTTPPTTNQIFIGTDGTRLTYDGFQTTLPDGSFSNFGTPERFGAVPETPGGTAAPVTNPAVTNPSVTVPGQQDDGTIVVTGQRETDPFVPLVPTPITPTPPVTPVVTQPPTPVVEPPAPKPPPAPVEVITPSTPYVPVPTPPVPEDPTKPRVLGPVTPLGFGDVGRIFNPGLNPGFIQPSPYYNTSSPVQSQYYYGQRPYQPGPQFDQALYNQVPNAPAVPFGLQQMYTPTDLNQYLNQFITGPVAAR
jgi:hypothetical protein